MYERLPSVLTGHCEYSRRLEVPMISQSWRFSFTRPVDRPSIQWRLVTQSLLAAQTPNRHLVAQQANKRSAKAGQNRPEIDTKLPESTDGHAQHNVDVNFQVNQQLGVDAAPGLKAWVVKSLAPQAGWPRPLGN